LANLLGDGVCILGVFKVLIKNLNQQTEKFQIRLDKVIESL